MIKKTKKKQIALLKAYRSSSACCLYLSLPFVLYCHAAILKLHLSKHTGLNPGCCVIQTIFSASPSSCFTMSVDNDSVQPTNSKQQLHSCQFVNRSRMQLPHLHLKMETDYLTYWTLYKIMYCCCISDVFLHLNICM